MACAFLRASLGVRALATDGRAFRASRGVRALGAPGRALGARGHSRGLRAFGRHIDCARCLWTLGSIEHALGRGVRGVGCRVWGLDGHAIDHARLGRSVRSFSLIGCLGVLTEWARGGPNHPQVPMLHRMNADLPTTGRIYAGQLLCVTFNSCTAAAAAAAAAGPATGLTQ